MCRKIFTKKISKDYLLKFNFLSLQPYLLQAICFTAMPIKKLIFLKWRNDIPGVSIFLIKGNHDVLTNKFYEEANIKVAGKKLSIKKFCFTHDIAAECDPDGELFTFSGHIHPGIKVNGNGKQSFMLPCFYFSDTYAVLPAFSLFTGLYKLRPKKRDNVFALVENQVIKMQ